MHEMSLSRSLLDIIEEQARLRHFAKVKAVTVELGCMGHVDSHALRFCFDVVTRSTLAEGSELIIIDRPGKVACLDCGTINEAIDRRDACPTCGSQRVMVDGGEELKLAELEVD